MRRVHPFGVLLGGPVDLGGIAVLVVHRGLRRCACSWTCPLRKGRREHCLSSLLGSSLRSLFVSLFWGENGYDGVICQEWCTGFCEPAQSYGGCAHSGDCRPSFREAFFVPLSSFSEKSELSLWVLGSGVCCSGTCGLEGRDTLGLVSQSITV